MRYDIVTLDLGLPDADGLNLLELMRTDGLATPVLILSARDSLDERIRGLDTGADDYLVKPFSVIELEARIRALLRRPRADEQWRHLGSLRCDFDSCRALIDSRELMLTRREFTLLETLMRRAGRVVNKEALFQAVFPFDSEASSNALEVHVSRLRRKLRGAGVAIQVLRGLGYRLCEIEEAAPA